MTIPLNPVYMRPLIRIPIQIKLIRVSTCKWGYRHTFCNCTSHFVLHKSLIHIQKYKMKSNVILIEIGRDIDEVLLMS